MHLLVKIVKKYFEGHKHTGMSLRVDSEYVSLCTVHCALSELYCALCSVGP